MVSDESVKQLHDKASRGQKLSVKERKTLENWYAIQDAAESEMLSLPANDKTIAALRKQLEAAQAQLVATMQRIQEITAENDALRRDIASLQRQLVHRREAQPA
jgi:chromosome segregation ATPase